MLLKRLRPGFRTLLARHRIPFQDAEDLVQDIVLQLVRKGEEVEDPASYLWISLHYRCLMYWRQKHGRSDEPMEMEELEELAEPVEAVQHHHLQLRHDLGRSLRLLRPRLRRLVCLRYGLGYTAREVAEQLGEERRHIKCRSIYARGAFIRKMREMDLL